MRYGSPIRGTPVTNLLSTPFQSHMCAARERVNAPEAVIGADSVRKTFATGCGAVDASIHHQPRRSKNVVSIRFAE